MRAETKPKREGLSRKESQLLSSLSAKGKTIITAGDVIEQLDCSRGNARKILSDLRAKRWLDHLVRGKYLIIPLQAGTESTYTEHEFIIASQLAEPYYIGYLSALNFHGLTEQVPYSVFVSTRKPLPSVTIHGIDYRLVTLAAHKFFGFKEYALANSRVEISDPEKTLIDCLDRPDLGGGIEEAAKGFRRAKGTLDVERAVGYALRMGSGSVVKRLRYLLDLTGYPVAANLSERLERAMTAGYPLLDPTAPASGHYRSKWGLRINLSQEALRGDES